jgi:hypothetical protein
MLLRTPFFLPIYNISEQKLLPRCRCVRLKRDMVWKMDLLATYIHHSELQVITALSPLLTLYTLLQYPLSLIPAHCIFICRSLAKVSNRKDSWASRSLVLSSQLPVQNSDLNWLTYRLAAICTNLLVFSSHAGFQISVSPQLSSL